MARANTHVAAKARGGRKRTSESPNFDVKLRASTRKLSLASTKSTRKSVESDASFKRQRSASQALSRTSSLPVQQDVSMTDAPLEEVVTDDHDMVEEYDLSNEPDYAEEAGQEDMDDDARSVITLSSEPATGDEAGYPVHQRPWLNFSELVRKDWEIMYSNVTPYAIHGDWSRTEAYQREKDSEMLRYMEDFPLAVWVIPQQQANNAYHQLLERMRCRSDGIPIYGRDRVPALSPDPAHVYQVPGAPAQLPPRNMREPPPGPGPSQYIRAHPSQPQSQTLPHHMLQNIQHPAMHPQPMPPHLLNQQVPQHLMAGHQHMVSVPHPDRGQLTPGVLPSQLYAQSIPVQHGVPPPGIGRPVGQPQSILYSIPLGTYIGQPVQSPYGPPMPVPVQNSGPLPPKAVKKPREKKATPATGTPPPVPPTPPYPPRTKPIELQKQPKKQRASTSRAGKRPVRRQAEAEEFPWTRRMNFPEAKLNASWDDTIYDLKTLDSMAKTREHNRQCINDTDQILQESQRQAKIAKKAEEEKMKADPTSETETIPKEPKKRGQNKNDAGDHSGGFSWADAASEKLGRALRCDIPEDAIDAGLAGDLNNDTMAKLRICWNPGKKGVTEDLQQVVFSVRDTVLTRQQLDNTPILTRRAAECIVDFCPDLLWRGLLLRVCSEGGYGNKDVRDRFCYNGCYCDKATITKRISAALGQKQQVSKSRGYLEGEIEWYDGNVKDFTCYIEYFGRRTGHRNLLKITMQSDKRRAAAEKRQSKASSEVASPGEGPSGQRPKLDAEDTHTSEAVDGEETESDGQGGVFDDNDAVSAQDSDILDELSDSD